MADQTFFSDYLFFHIANYALAILVYSLAGRFFLGLLLPPESGNYIWRFFCRLTDPVLTAARWLIPGYVLPGFRPLAAAFHLFVLRIALYLLLSAQGLAPRLAGTPGAG